MKSLYVLLLLFMLGVLSACSLDVSLISEIADSNMEAPNQNPLPNPTPYNNYFKSLVTGGAANYSVSRHTCGITRDDEVICWGNNLNGQLGNPDSSDSTFFKVKGGDQGGEFLQGVTQISLGQGHTCALTVDKEVYCWGKPLGLGAGPSVTTDQFEPRRVLAGEQSTTETYLQDIRYIEVGFDYSCALTEGGSVYCWGVGTFLGAGVAGNSYLPKQVVAGQQGLGTYLEDVSVLRVGFRNACVLDSGKSVYCWGDSRGVGIGLSTGTTLAPVKVLGGEQGGLYLENIKELLASWNTGCAVDEGGQLYCWGSNAKPLATGANASVPSKVLRLPEASGEPNEYLDNVQSISGGAGFCAILNDGKLVCWSLFGSQEYPTQILSDHFPGGVVQNLKSIYGNIGTFWMYDQQGRSYGFGVNYFNTFRGSVDGGYSSPVLYDETGE